MMREDLITLNSLREDAMQGASELREKRLKFEEENKELIDELKKINENAAEVIESIHKQALYDYGINKNKEIGFGIKIKLYKKYSFDKNKALAWAQEHKMALKLDEPALKKIAVATKGGIACVVIIEEPGVTIPGYIKVD